MSERVKVHMIGNAHLDPVWLWSWQAGVDEALATAYTAVKMLKEYPDFIFSRSDVWFHQTIEELNPELFAEIKKYVEAGRWQLIGGWYLQPDCNLPTEFGFRKHIEVGKKYFQEKFGKQVTIGYNPDSFGHAGSLPRILAESGYKQYIYMRPGPHEMEYPSKSQVFWWEAGDSNHRLLAYRIPVQYCTGTEQFPDILQRQIQESDTSLGHIMGFYGVGDHGGGPTCRQIEYIRENKTKFDGYELVFSHPQAYFDAVASKTPGLPVVKGELQHHAVGCYSVLHRIKQDLHRAEHELTQAGQLAAKFPQFTGPRTECRLEQAWQDVLFNQFHDTYGGTCLKTAYPDIYNQIGRARANADQERTNLIRRLSATFPKLELGDTNYLAFFAALNSHDQDSTGWVEHELFAIDKPELKFVEVDNQNIREIPFQKVRPEGGISSPPRFLVPVKLTAGEHKIIAVKAEKPKNFQTDIRTAHDQIQNTFCQIKSRPTGLLLTAENNFHINLTWQVFEDLSDTWSHERFRLGDRHIGAMTQEKTLIEEEGPLRASMTWMGDFLHSQIRVRARVYRDEKWVELLINLLWNQPKAMVKMVIEPQDPILEHTDGNPGGSQARPLDGKEYPFHDWTLLTCKQNQVAFISPDLYGFDTQKENARFSLVRSPAYAFHDPAKMEENKYSYEFLDMGEHDYRVLISTNGKFKPEKLQKIARQLQQPAIHWDPPYRENYPNA
jgi:alpha-mannosidase